MIIAFDTELLREICEDPQVAQRELGVERARLLQDRLADLRAAETIDDLLVGNPRVEGAKRMILRVTLESNADVLLEANHSRLPLSGDGNTDWQRVSYVKVTKVGDSR